MDTIRIEDLDVLCRIGVPDDERSKPQRLLITVEMDGDFSAAAASDDIEQTINYYEVAQWITRHCHENSFRLIERLADEICRHILTTFHPERVSVTVKKFILPNARTVGVRLTRSR